jgi:ubiquinone/menaquinone biosynthesis C-methylase UbiE
MIKFFCPKCKIELCIKGDKFICSSCSYTLQKIEGVVISQDAHREVNKKFYDDLYETDHGKQWYQGLNRSSFLKRISLGYRRERFFKRNLSGGDNIILDLACGAGRDYFTEYGTVVGVDLSLEPLKIAKNRYQFVLQSGVTKLPFADNTFDYVTSADFFGHITAEDKNLVQKEINRILKPGGKAINIIETDSTNIWFRIAHRQPELFQKYFIEKIGGHIGLELPTECISRWEASGFKIDSAEKLWGLVWPIRDYASLFDNEYAKDSAGIKLIVFISKFFGKIKIIEVLINIILNPVSYLVEKLFPLNNGQGLMLVCKKK